jgi:hypothetical protein
MPRGEPLDDLPAGRRIDLSPENGIPTPRTQPLPRHHANAPRRRPKTLGELRIGWEFVEIYDRRFPGRMAARSAR